MSTDAITTQRIYEAMKDHPVFLLKATSHDD
jgi:hypothetical protein